MNEQNTQQQAAQQQPLQFETTTYIGKQWVKTFSNDDGTETKSYKYMFKAKPEDQWARNYWGYDTTKGVNILEEGSLVNVGYIEKPNNKGDKPIRCARFFGVPTEAQKLQAQQQSMQNTQQNWVPQTQPMGTSPTPTTTQPLPQIVPQVQAGYKQPPIPGVPLPTPEQAEVLNAIKGNQEYMDYIRTTDFNVFVECFNNVAAHLGKTIAVSQGDMQQLRVILLS